MKKKKGQYRVRNWPEYNKSLVKRGRLTVWLSVDALAEWRSQQRTHQPGRPDTYSDLAIECMGMLQVMYRLSLRATQGLLQSILNMLKTGLVAPDYTTLCRRRKTLAITLPHSPLPDGAGMHLVVDSTGIKVHGEGEWMAYRHRTRKQRVWCKLHIGVNEATGEIVTAAVSSSHVADCRVLPYLLSAVSDMISQLSADGAYDAGVVYDLLSKRDIKAVIPPKSTAKIWWHGNSAGPPHARDANLRAIRTVGRKQWKRQSGYHRRSLAETAMSRLKRTFGSTMNARSLPGQAAESLLRCKLLNAMTRLGRPDSYLMTS